MKDHQICYNKKEMQKGVIHDYLESKVSILNIKTFNHVITCAIKLRNSYLFEIRKYYSIYACS